MKLKTLIILFLLTLTSQAWAWRIEGEILYLEKGDNIWQVAYSLTGDGGNWRELWATRIDTTVTNCVFLRFRTPNPVLTGHSVLT